MLENESKRVAGWLGLGLVLVALLPYLLAYRAAGDEFVFSGFLLNPIDGNTYLAKMYQGWQGHWKYSLPYTAVVEEGAYLFLFYLFLGHISRLFSIPLLVTFHASRIIGTVLMVWALDRFVRVLEVGRRDRSFGLALALFGSGLGWLGLMFGAFTSDLWVAEAYPFLSAYANPHFPIGLALVVWLLTPQTGDKGIGDGGERDEGIGDKGWLLAIMSFILALISPFGVVIVLVILGTAAAWELWDKLGAGKDWKQLQIPDTGKKFIYILVGGMPVLVYYFWVVKTNPAFAEWNRQNLTPSPPIWDFLLSFSPILWFAIPGAVSVYRSGDKSQRILLIWAGLGVVLSYLPLGLQRRFLMGLYFPLAILAVIGAGKLLAQSRKKYILGLTILFLLVIPTNLIILATSIYGIQTRDPLLYLTKNEAQAFDWISENSGPEAIILSAPQTGSFVPAHTGRRVLYGHPFETGDANRMEALVESYFRGDIREADQKSLQIADYIFVGPRERRLGNCPCTNGMQIAYENESVSVFRRGTTFLR